MSHYRTSVKATLEAKGIELEAEGKNKDMSYNGGISMLDKTSKESAHRFTNQLAEYGIFTVRDGALESWLKPLNVENRKSQWLVKMFEAMGENPDLPEYVKPNEHDVWEFMSTIKAWLINPERSGIPE